MTRAARPTITLAALTLAAAPAFAQDAPVETQLGLWPLFAESFDIFSVVLILGSIAAVALIVRAIVEVRASRILPDESAAAMRSLARDADYVGLRDRAERDESVLAPIVLAALDSPPDRPSRREAAEQAASEQIADQFGRIELLNLIGNVAPLVGLAGTVWGMIIAFTTLGEAGGNAGPAALSLGVSKALFHTLLGLVLAIPCLVAFGMFRARLDRLCTKALAIGSEIVERLPDGPLPEPPESDEPKPGAFSRARTSAVSTR